MYEECIIRAKFTVAEEVGYDYFRISIDNCTFRIERLDRKATPSYPKVYETSKGTIWATFGFKAAAQRHKMDILNHLQNFV